MFAACSLICGTAKAQDRVQKLVNQLRAGRDFRVRTQAALALGATKSPRAVSPLCGGLRDPNRTVRAASAAALGKLGQRGGTDCLKARLEVESSSVVKASIRKSLVRLSGSEINEDTKFYLSIEKAKSDLEKPEVADTIRAAMVRSARSLKGYAVAPQDETAAEAKKLLNKHPKVKGFYLAPKLAKPSYAGGNLSVRINVAMFRYPDKTLIGEFSVRLTQPGVTADDRTSLVELIRMAGDRAMQKFSQNAHRF